MDLNWFKVRRSVRFVNVESFKEYLEKNDFKINQIGALKVFSPDFKAGNTETGPDYVEVITNPTTSSGYLCSRNSA